MSHTPTPWREYPAHELNDLLTEDQYYRSIESGRGYQDADKGGFCLSGFINPEDSAFMIRACNSHDALIASMKLMLKCMDGPRIPKYMQLAVKQAKEALAAAEAQS